MYVLLPIPFIVEGCVFVLRYMSRMTTIVQMLIHIWYVNTTDGGQLYVSFRQAT